MAKSSAPLLVLTALAWGGAGAAQRPDPQALVEAQRDQVRGMIRPSCRVSDDPESIVVCGRRDERGPRGPLPALPYAPEEGRIDTANQAGGEQLAAMANSQCIRLCPQPLRIDPITAAISVVRAIERLADD